jgi:hypothetical protein
MRVIPGTSACSSAIVVDHVGAIPVCVAMNRPSGLTSGSEAPSNGTTPNATLAVRTHEDLLTPAGLLSGADVSSAPTRRDEMGVVVVVQETRHDVMIRQDKAILKSII